MVGNDGKQVQQTKADVQMLAHRLAKDADISENDARELIKLIGTDWAFAAARSPVPQKPTLMLPAGQASRDSLRAASAL
ncbi:MULTISPECIES: hypothetical protein [unclassified Mesorhizobium]|uniref:hypothetical protein n=1 Tax=unclassified Mesorhizobium TaxID=325217 RepID=UPI000FCCAD51|nr:MULTISPECIES: hypothetical protein [unclassified Mesorhizobium]RUV23392.1 hypothetical protein EOA91_13650 [Mesorhizobium sp. M1A.F.Ca.IN.022.04.1.1]RWG31085.1 MAG: hypothetical protein EOQ60_17300 [Mesorhizobium sp.]